MANESRMIAVNIILENFDLEAMFCYYLQSLYIKAVTKNSNTTYKQATWKS